MATRIAVDIGGTFTDLVYYDDAASVTVEGKVPTVPLSPDQGVIAAIRQHVPREVIESAEYFLHGTTVGLNALLERRGATVGLITTAGFRDVLEIRRGDRAQMYNLFWRQPEPLVPRRRRLEVIERVMFDGSVLRSLQEDGLQPILESFRREAVDSIAVCLLNSYANPVHELRVEECLRSAGYTGAISLSHRVSGEYREYERSSTTVIDAFVRARMADYLKRLDRGLRELGFRGVSLITRSGGGSMTFADAEERPFETIMSGPVGGAEGARDLARTLGIRSLITADVGGTSFDTAMVLDGQLQVLYEGKIGDMPIQSPWVDVRSIGSGGGSIAYIDAGGLMRVGPRSAGAVPGPAAYGKGGVEATVTDAAAVLGMLGEGRLAGGIHLALDRAQAALQPLGQAIGHDVDGAAIGVLRIAAAAMANAMREVTVEQGLDPRSVTLLPFGGAGPLMACLLAEELGMRQIVVPRFAGNFSAWGLLGADLVQSAARTCLLALTDDNLVQCAVLLRELFAAIDARGEPTPHVAVETARFDLRFRGQEHWLSIEMAYEGGHLLADAATITGQFHVEYARAFGSTLDDAVEIVAVRATKRVDLPRRRADGLGQPTRAAGGSSSRESMAHESTVSEPAVSESAVRKPTVDAYSFRLQRRVPFRLIERDDIRTGCAGPAVITETTTTAYVDAGWRVRMGACGELILDRETVTP